MILARRWRRTSLSRPYKQTRSRCTLSSTRIRWLVVRKPGPINNQVPTYVIRLTTTLTRPPQSALQSSGMPARLSDSSARREIKLKCEWDARPKECGAKECAEAIIIVLQMARISEDYASFICQAVHWTTKTVSWSMKQRALSIVNMAVVDLTMMVEEKMVDE